MATEFIRVKSKSTGHEYSLPVDAFDPDAHTKVKGDAEQDGIPVPPVINEKVGEGKQVPAVDTPSGPVSGPSMV